MSHKDALVSSKAMVARVPGFLGTGREVGHCAGCGACAVGDCFAVSLNGMLLLLLFVKGAARRQGNWAECKGVGWGCPRSQEVLCLLLGAENGGQNKCIVGNA
jgi:hypothetical protein